MAATKTENGKKIYTNKTLFKNVMKKEEKYLTNRKLEDWWI